MSHKKLVTEYGSDDGLCIMRIYFTCTKTMQPNAAKHNDNPSYQNADTPDYDSTITAVEALVPCHLPNQVIPKMKGTFLPPAFWNDKEVYNELLDFVNDNAAMLYEKD
jgi:hypothetical protein